jgi:hypothetical protein
MFVGNSRTDEAMDSRASRERDSCVDVCRRQLYIVVIGGANSQFVEEEGHCCMSLTVVFLNAGF